MLGEESRDDVADAANVGVSDEPAPEAARNRHFVVGMGASAGGLEALSALISRLPDNLGASYVVVQHMSPQHRSMLVPLLARATSIPVGEATDGGALLPDHIYVTPPNRNVALRDGRFVLTEPAAETVPKPSINAFFNSLAEDRSEDAIAIVLSGTGSDGAAGVRAVKASGGVVFVQEPGSAKYSGMPRAAIDTECVDRIMTPEQIASEIEVVLRSQGEIAVSLAGGQVKPTLRTLLQRVMRHARVDFSGYKESTVWRRILRRMVSNRVNSLEEYLLLTEKNPDELNQLSKEILISVTSFFRDPHAFKALREPLGQLLAKKNPGEEIRIWVAGCATGEEAYSVAILISELLGHSLRDFRVQIFATDIDLNAMAVARRGVYPESALAELDPALVDRYFIRWEGSCEVGKATRDMVVFARQDLAQDPPFLRLDLITCRNVLIYFQGMLQGQVLSGFHYALRPGGLLFLGKSETVHQRDGQFESLSRDARIFRRRDGQARLPQMFATGGEMAVESRPAAARTRATPEEENLLRAVLEAGLPPSVVVTSQLEVLHVFGDVSGFLNIRSGRPDFNLLTLIRPEWRIDAQTAVFQAIQRRQPAVGRLHGGETNGRLTVRPLGIKFADNEDRFLVGFQSIAPVEENFCSDGEQAAGSPGRCLEEELIATREHLRAVVEQLETANQDAQALNEELQTSNEELQASNEELQASNEELQSTNEELITVNEELQIKSAELAEANADLENIQNSIGFVILVVNDQMRLMRYNLAAQQCLNLGQGSIGESLRAIPGVLAYADLIASVEQVLRERCPVERQVGHDGRHFSLRVMPRFMSSRDSRGAVVTLSEESDLVEARRCLMESERRLRSVMSHTAAAVAVKDTAGRYEYANPGFCRLFGIAEEALLGRTDQQVFPAELAETMRSKDLDTLRRDGLVESDDVLRIAGRDRRFGAVRFPLKAGDGVSHAVCVQLTEKLACGER